MIFKVIVILLYLKLYVTSNILNWLGIVDNLQRFWQLLKPHVRLQLISI